MADLSLGDRLAMSDDSLPYGPRMTDPPTPVEAFSIGHVELRRHDELENGDLVWHRSTLLYRPLEMVSYRMDARWELHLQGGHSLFLPDRCSPHPNQVRVLVGAGPEFLRRSNNGLGAPAKEIRWPT